MLMSALITLIFVAPMHFVVTPRAVIRVSANQAIVEMERLAVVCIVIIVIIKQIMVEVKSRILVTSV